MSHRGLTITRARLQFAKTNKPKKTWKCSIECILLRAAHNKNMQKKDWKCHIESLLSCTAHNKNWQKRYEMPYRLAFITHDSKLEKQINQKSLKCPRATYHAWCTKNKKKGLEMRYWGLLSRMTPIYKTNKPKKSLKCSIEGQLSVWRTKKQAKKVWKCCIKDVLSHTHDSNFQKQINQEKPQMPCRGHIIMLSAQGKNRQKMPGNAVPTAYYHARITPICRNK